VAVAVAAESVVSALDWASATRMPLLPRALCCRAHDTATFVLGIPRTGGGGGSATGSRHQQGRREDRRRVLVQGCCVSEWGAAGATAPDGGEQQLVPGRGGPPLAAPPLAHKTRPALRGGAGAPSPPSPIVPIRDIPIETRSKTSDAHLTHPLLAVFDSHRLVHPNGLRMRARF